MAKKKEDGIKLEVVFTEGYEKRFTEACLKVFAAHERRKLLELAEVMEDKAVNE